jgi:hypothetical protein
MNFRILNKFLEILTGNEFGKWKNGVIVLGHYPAHDLVMPAQPTGKIGRPAQPSGTEWAHPQ